MQCVPLSLLVYNGRNEISFPEWYEYAVLFWEQHCSLSYTKPYNLFSIKKVVEYYMYRTAFPCKLLFCLADMPSSLCFFIISCIFGLLNFFTPFLFQWLFFFPSNEVLMLQNCWCFFDKSLKTRPYQIDDQPLEGRGWRRKHLSTSDTRHTPQGRTGLYPLETNCLPIYPLHD